ncbi:hypothetical protein [Thiolapillus sp.]
MKQRDVIRYLHMGCGESLAARQFPQPVPVTAVASGQPAHSKTATRPKRRKAHEEQR